MSDIGKPLSIEDVEEILEALKRRAMNFPDEPQDMTLALVLMNIGNRRSKVSCNHGEWRGVLRDIPPTPPGQVPTCPKGHPLIQHNRVSIGWVEVE